MASLLSSRGAVAFRAVVSSASRTLKWTCTVQLSTIAPAAPAPVDSAIPPPPPPSETSAASVESEEPKRSDWYYIAAGLAALSVIGGPLYLTYLTQHDLEVRTILEQDYPAIFEQIKPHVDLTSHLPEWVRSVEPPPENHAVTLQFSNGRTFTTTVSGTDTLSSLSAQYGTADVPVTDVKFPSDHSDCDGGSDGGCL